MLFNLSKSHIKKIFLSSITTTYEKYIIFLTPLFSQDKPFRLSCAVTDIRETTIYIL